MRNSLSEIMGRKITATPPSIKKDYMENKPTGYYTQGISMVLSAALLTFLSISNIKVEYVIGICILSSAYVVHDSLILSMVAGTMLISILLLETTGLDSFKTNLHKVIISSVLSTILTFNCPWAGLITYSYPILVISRMYNENELNKKLREEVLLNTQEIAREEDDKIIDIQEKK